MKADYGFTPKCLTYENLRLVKNPVDGPNICRKR
jgi:hypothetical protein